MTTTYLTLSDAGGVVCVSGRADEKIITAKADGTAKAGHVVAVRGIGTVGTDGDILGVTVAANVTDWFTGILLPKYNVDCDTAVADGDLVEIVIPKARRFYNVAISDPGGDKEIGMAVDFPAADVGNMAIAGSAIETVDYYAITTQLTKNGSRFCEVRWA